MLPQNKNVEDLMEDFEEEQQPSRTYRIDYERKRIVGFIDERAAIEQAIYKALSTERYEYLIYTWNYGAEIAKLFGQPIPYVYSELQRLVTEALTHDDRIDSVDAFSFSHVKNKVLMSFTAHTTFGAVEIEREVMV